MEILKLSVLEYFKNTLYLQMHFSEGKKPWEPACIFLFSLTLYILAKTISTVAINNKYSEIFDLRKLLLFSVFRPSFLDLSEAVEPGGHYCSETQRERWEMFLPPLL